MKTMGFFNLDTTGKTYIRFLSNVPVSTGENYLQIKRFIQMILGVHASNIFRFGRSSCTALAFATTSIQKSILRYQAGIVLESLPCRLLKSLVLATLSSVHSSYRRSLSHILEKIKNSPRRSCNES
jgi:hypothetical protein